MRTYRLGFVMEQTLGHITHARNLRPHVCADLSVEADWMPVQFSADDRWERMPAARSNWTIRASFRARDLVRRALDRGPLDGLFYHTQATSLLAGGLARQIPTVVSLDATPKMIDRMAEAYGHVPSRFPMVERAKDRLLRRVFQRAAHLVTWCDVARTSLVDDYGLPQDKVTTLAPGVDLARWQCDRASRRAGPVRLLFVGGDFERKGGPLLLRAFRERLAGTCVLDIVTRRGCEVDLQEGVAVRTELGPNSPELVGLFEAADIFVLPTLGDILPMVCMEAMAAGLPVVATDVGAIREEVLDGETGILVRPGDSDALGAAVERLAADADLRAAMGQAGRGRAENRFSADRNYTALVALLKGCVDGAQD